jgi:hypothetical protein
MQARYVALRSIHHEFIENMTLTFLRVNSHDELLGRVKLLEAHIEERNSAMAEVQSHLEKLHGAGAEWDAERTRLQVGRVAAIIRRVNCPLITCLAIGPPR